MKKKLMGILALSLVFSACGVQKYTYVSQRHPEANSSAQEESSNDTEESTDIKYTTPDGSEQNTDTEEAAPEEAGSEEVDGVEYQAANNLNMRLAPSTSSSVVTEVPGGATVIKIGENGEWTRATYQGYTGYILTELLIPAQ